MTNRQEDDEFEVRVKHHRPGPNCYTWQIRRRDKLLPIKESRTYFPSWQDATNAGNEELRKLKRL
jgi:hypothetical protein